MPILVLFLLLCFVPAAAGQEAAVRLIIVDPGHFHAALVQKDMYPFLSPRVSVYSSLSPELIDFLNRISLFNLRRENPTRWELDIHTGPDFFDRMLRDKAGNVAMFAGRNRGKIDRILRCLEAGYHVYADKPWIIASADLPKLERALDMAPRKGLGAYDIMTERFEITSILQRELVNAPGVFGKLVPGSVADPAIRARSVHHLMKLVAGVPIRRPVAFFDIRESGEALADVGTHVVDLAQWTAFPEQMLDYHTDIRILGGRRWPTVISPEQFKQVTGADGFPPQLSQWIRDGKLDYYTNNSVDYTLRGTHIGLEIVWNWEAPPGVLDFYEATFRGTRARIELRQGAAEKFVPEIYVVPEASVKAEVFAALRRTVESWQARWPGVAVEQRAAEARLTIPAKYRVGHEAHFAQVTNLFFEYLRDPNKLPAWERNFMLAKYYVSTKGVEISHAGGK